MAWQNSAAMVANGGGPSNGGEVGNGQPQGTEYTLQGVMRFLQTEWHRHERDRNAWEIERAEMKSRVGKLEGDGRTAKRLQETLGKHVKILENALRREREKVKKMQSSGDGTADTASESGKENLKASANPSVKSEESNQEIDHENVPGFKQDAQRDKSRLYLGKCIQEVTYHVIPTTVAQQAMAEEQEMLQNHQYSNQLAQQSLDEAYSQQRQKQQQSHPGMMVPSTVPNHQPPPIPRITELAPLTRASQASEQAPFMSRSNAESIIGQTGPITSIPSRHPPGPNYGFPPVIDEQLDKRSPDYESFGQQMPNREEEKNPRISEEHEGPEGEGWTFDVEAEATNAGAPPPDYAPSPRPDTEGFPNAHDLPLKSPPRGRPPSHGRKTSITKRRQSDGAHELRELSLTQNTGSMRGDPTVFKVRTAFRGHLDVVRSVIFTGGGTPAEPEICTAGDDGVIKRWIIPASYGTTATYGGPTTSDLDVTSNFTHRGHSGAVMCLAAAPASQNFLNGGRALGDGWVFSGGQDAAVRVWERGRVDPKATMDGHTDAIWSICILPGSAASILGDQGNRHGGLERMLLASGSADGTILIWAVSSPPQLTSPSAGSRRGAGGSRRANSISSGSNFPSSPQPSTATAIPFHYSLVHRIERVDHPSPTCISPLSMTGDNFVVAYSDASVLIYDTRTAEEIVGMASQETYDGTPPTGVNAVAATTVGLESTDPNRSGSDDDAHGATGSSSGIEGMVLSGHEDRYIRFFDANSGQCTYNMLAHPSAISALSLSPDGRELVSAGHDASLRFWSLEKRSCTQEISSHRLMRGEGVCAVVWSSDGRWVVSGGGDGTVKVWARDTRHNLTPLRAITSRISTKKLTNEDRKKMLDDCKPS